MRILVTGGAGFIGSNFVHYCLSETDYSVTTLDALTYAGDKTNLDGVLQHPQHKFVEGDIRDKGAVVEAMRDADIVVNFAAESHVDRSIESAEPFVSTNVGGVQALLDAARSVDINRFVQISTDEVYGQIESGTFAESDPLNPRNPYAATKAGADHLARSYFITYGLPVVITRSSNNYGPQQHPEKLIPKFIQRAVHGEPLPLYGDGQHVREWTFVEDNCRAIETVIQKGVPGEAYNIGSGTELENIEVAERIVKQVGASTNLIEYVNDRPGHDSRYALETEKIESLGWQPKWSFEEGLRRTIDFYRE